MIEAELPMLEPSRFEKILDLECRSDFDRTLGQSARLLEGRTLIHVNSAMTGGGVAELLGSVFGYLRGTGVRSRWFVLEGSEDFFVLTKRIHHFLHGRAGDGGSLGLEEASLYESVLAHEMEALTRKIKPGDVVVLHDPQVVGLASPLRELGAIVIWNCHVGADVPNEYSRRAWQFLLPSANRAQAQVFSRTQYPWDGLDKSRVAIIPPCIDAFSPKNQALDQREVDAILAATGVAKWSGADSATFTRVNGSPGNVSHATQLFEDCPLPVDAPVVTQVSRWDPLKDHAGVALAFADAVPSELGAHLVLAGPSPEAVADDPEGAQTLEDLLECRFSLPGAVRARVHVACIPMEDIEENAAIVNALQRRSDVVVQKSLAEGFGLTVAEAMWKSRPMVANAVGGIRDQIRDEVNGLLVRDPADHRSFGAAISRLLCDRRIRTSLGETARQSVLHNFLAPKYLSRYLELVESVVVD